MPKEWPLASLQREGRPQLSIELLSSYQEPKPTMLRMMQTQQACPRTSEKMGGQLVIEIHSYQLAGSRIQNHPLGYDSPMILLRAQRPEKLKPTNKLHF
jgi:hypothetical protein